MTTMTSTLFAFLLVHAAKGICPLAPDSAVVLSFTISGRFSHEGSSEKNHNEYATSAKKEKTKRRLNQVFTV